MLRTWAFVNRFSRSFLSFSSFQYAPLTFLPLPPLSFPLIGQWNARGSSYVEDLGDQSHTANMSIGSSGNVDPVRAAETRAPQILIVSTVISVIAFIFVCLRSYTRFFIVRSYGPQDALMVTSVVSALPRRQENMYANGMMPRIAHLPPWRNRDPISASASRSWQALRYDRRARSCQVHEVVLRPDDCASHWWHRLPQNLHCP